jgi:hypothetical protein
VESKFPNSTLSSCKSIRRPATLSCRAQIALTALGGKNCPRGSSADWRGLVLPSNPRPKASSLARIVRQGWFACDE